MFICFDRIHERDGRQTASIALRGKKEIQLWPRIARQHKRTTVRLSIMSIMLLTKAENKAEYAPRPLHARLP